MPELAEIVRRGLWCCFVPGGYRPDLVIGMHWLQLHVRQRNYLLGYRLYCVSYDSRVRPE